MRALVAARRWTFAGAFDAVFSNAALHLMRQPAAVIAGVRRALRPGGRFVAEMGGEGNIATIVDALAARGVDHASALPWYFPGVVTYRELLDAAGFTVTAIALHARPTPIKAGAAGWLDTFADGIFSALPERARAAARDEVIARLEQALRGPDGRWTADYVRLRFRALLPDPAATPR